MIINEVLIATELAHRRMLTQIGISEEECWYENNTDAQYTEEAQKVFNYWYDYYWNILEDNKEGDV